VFPNQQYIKIIWIGIENEQPIITLTKRLDEQLFTLGFAKEKREFSPHLTIGRVRTAKNKEHLLHAIQTYSDTSFGEFFVDSITLKKSDLTEKGPIYTTIKKTSFPTR
jgi:2'-5' RNA ligase